MNSTAASALAAEDWANAIQVVSGSAHWLTLKVACHLLTADRVVRFMTELQSSAPDESRDLLIAAFRVGDDEGWNPFLVAGVGIVAGSDPASELAETQRQRIQIARQVGFAECSRKIGNGSRRPNAEAEPRRC